VCHRRAGHGLWVRGARVATIASSSQDQAVIRDLCGHPLTSHHQWAVQRGRATLADGSAFSRNWQRSATHLPRDGPGINGNSSDRPGTTIAGQTASPWPHRRSRRHLNQTHNPLVVVVGHQQRGIRSGDGETEVPEREVPEMKSSSVGSSGSPVSPRFTWPRSGRLSCLCIGGR
jgi:hypothetical protein